MTLPTTLKSDIHQWLWITEIYEVGNKIWPHMRHAVLPSKPKHDACHIFTRVSPPYRARRSVAAFICGCEVSSGVRVQPDPPHLRYTSALSISPCLSLSLSLSRFRKWFRVQSDIILERFQEFLKTQSDRPVQLSNEKIWQAVLT